MWDPNDFCDLVFDGVSKAKIWTLFLEIAQLKRSAYIGNAWLTPNMNSDESKEGLYRERLTSSDCKGQKFLELIKECWVNMQITFKTSEFEANPRFAATQVYFYCYWDYTKPESNPYYQVEFNFLSFGHKS